MIDLDDDALFMISIIFGLLIILKAVIMFMYEPFIDTTIITFIGYIMYRRYILVQKLDVLSVTLKNDLKGMQHKFQQVLDKIEKF